MRRSAPAAIVAALTVALLAGCTGGSTAGSTAAGSGAVDFQADSGRVPAPAAAASGRAAQAAPADRSIVTTASLRLVTDEPIAVADRVRLLAQQAGGRVGSSTEDPSGRGSARLVLRIPSAVFDRTLAQIQRQGTARDVTIGATDVTAQVTDYAVRIANLRTSIARLQQLLAKADSSSSLVTIEGALTERQTSLEQLLAQQRDLADQVGLATLTVSVVTPAAVPVKGPGDFLAAFAVGARSLVEAGAAALIGLGVALPWLVAAGAVVGAGFAVRRLVRRRPTSA